jgi:hypothetical protein
VPASWHQSQPIAAGWPTWPWQQSSAPQIVGCICGDGCTANYGQVCVCGISPELCFLCMSGNVSWVE